MRAPVPSILVLGLVAGWSFNARAADIAAILGVPGSPEWEAACGPGAAPPPDPSTFECSGFVTPACMHRVDIDPAEFPAARCSDGTPATFYVNEGAGPDRDKWVIHLQGGAWCDDYDSCLERWCGTDFYTAGQMSSDWTGDGITDLPETFMAAGHQLGLFNPWDSHTHVYVPYCSSDGWMGRANNIEMTDGVDDFRVDARGHAILYAVRRMLRKNSLDPNWTSVDGELTPDLDDADEVLLTGTSSGGWGALHNADWFLGPLGARTAVAIDGSLDVDPTVLDTEGIEVDTDGDGIGDVGYALHLAQQYRDMWLPGGFLEEMNAFVDESCRFIEEPRGEMERCTLPSRLLMGYDGPSPYVQQPIFIRHDLEDAVLASWFIDEVNPDGDTVLFSGPMGLPVTLDDYARMMRQTLRRLHNNGDPVSGVFGPRCGSHVGLERAVPYWVVTTPDTVLNPFTREFIDVFGTTTTFHDALWSWFDPGGTGIVPIRRLDSPQVGGAFSGC